MGPWSPKHVNAGAVGVALNGVNFEQFGRYRARASNVIIASRSPLSFPT